MVRDTIPSDVSVVLTAVDLTVFQVLHALINEGPEDDFCVEFSAALLDLINRYEMAVNRSFLEDAREKI